MRNSPVDFVMAVPASLSTTFTLLDEFGGAAGECHCVGRTRSGRVKLPCVLATRDNKVEARAAFPSLLSIYHHLRKSSNRFPQTTLPSFVMELTGKADKTARSVGQIAVAALGDQQNHEAYVENNRQHNPRHM